MITMRMETRAILTSRLRRIFSPVLRIGTFTLSMYIIRDIYSQDYPPPPPGLNKVSGEISGENINPGILGNQGVLPQKCMTILPITLNDKISGFSSKMYLGLQKYKHTIIALFHSSLDLHMWTAF